jgi:ABC-type Fe3+-hydroxamate transport system substrate-binding protein
MSRASATGSTAKPVRRVVSLVPSLTETVAVSAPGLVVGATDWCSHPAELDVVRVGGTKNPRLDDVTALRPDIVLVNDEENRPEDIDELRRRGVATLITDYKAVPDAIRGLADLLDRLDLEPPEWLDDAEAAWAEPWDGPTAAAVIPIWRRPWMALGRDTFAGDLLARVGVSNVLAEHEARYPRIDLESMPQHDIVVLPDEPYAFAADDGPEAFAAPCRLVSGRHLTWYGPSLAEARDVLAAQLWASAAP